ncbi:hypothetical protein AMECASPLE_022824 [Ameca splendens]|uniref:Uncharacterized protein n=1 Tax=Ameca splendens TaxID=208324 RepID=A0ABV0ZQ49_9TELE
MRKPHSLPELPEVLSLFLNVITRSGTQPPPRTHTLADRNTPSQPQHTGLTRFRRGNLHVLNRTRRTCDNRDD